MTSTKKSIIEEEILAGNYFDKYNSKNPVVNWLMKGFQQTLTYYIEKCSPGSIHEIGCGEGFWTIYWQQQGYNARGSDFSFQIIEYAKNYAKQKGISPEIFSQRDIYNLSIPDDQADLIICSEVLEHLKHPIEALKILRDITTKYIVFSVPREPLWRILNIMRGKYISHLGNTPGHIQHWTKKQFIDLISVYFEILEIKTPLPWVIILGCAKNFSPK